MKIRKSQDPLIERFCSMVENDFSKLVLMPLLYALGYNRIEFYGGNKENGKDLIAFQADKFGNDEVTVFIVKKLKQTTAANESKTFHTSVKQLEQAAESNIPFLDGWSKQPTEVVFVTPHSVDVRILESRFEKFAQVRANRLKYLDGDRIASLCREKCPQISSEILGAEDSVAIALESMFTNATLLRALGSNTIVSVDSFHVGLDFSMGRRKLGSILKSEFTPLPGSLTNTPGEVSHERLFLRSLEERYKIRLIDDSEFDSPKNVVQAKTLRDSIIEIETRVNKNNDELALLEETFSKYHKDGVVKMILDKPVNRARRAYGEVEDQIDEAISKEKRERTVVEKQKLKDADDALKEGLADLELTSELQTNCNTIFHQRISDSTTTKPTVSKTMELRRFLKRLSDALKKSVDDASISAIIIENLTASINIKLATELLEGNLKVKRGQLMVKTSIAINTDALCRLLTTTCSQIRQILADVHNCNTDSMFNEALSQFGDLSMWMDRILSFAISSNCVLVSGDKRELQTTRLSLEKVFASGKSVLLLGEAGSGKTTSLQAYAKRLLEQNDKRRFVLYFPLGSVSGSNTTISTVDQLEAEFVRFLRRFGGLFNSNELSKKIQVANSTIILDALDEAIAASPLIVDAIVQLKERYADAQLIVSSREIGLFTHRLSLSPVTLQPFSLRQLGSFIKRYCTANNRSDDATRVLEHLDNHRKLKSIVRTPLLAALLCELAINQEIELPRSEVQMYEDRFKLLSGTFDIAKQIAPRVSFKPDDFRKACLHLAYGLHKLAKRYVRREELVEMLVGQNFATKWTRGKANAIVSELIEPCQLLVPMSEEAGYGFGHLRFQEYFACCELLQWQSDKLSVFLNERWWRDVFVLYSLMSDHLDQFIDALNYRILTEDARGTIRIMMRADLATCTQTLGRKLKRETSIASRLAIESLLA